MPANSTAPESVMRIRYGSSFQLPPDCVQVLGGEISGLDEVQHQGRCGAAEHLAYEVFQYPFASSLLSLRRPIDVRASFLSMRQMILLFQDANNRHDAVVVP